MKSIKHLSVRERKKYMKCACGQYFNMQSIEEVKRHLHKRLAAEEEESEKDKPVNLNKKD